MYTVEELGVCHLCQAILDWRENSTKYLLAEPGQGRTGRVLRVVYFVLRTGRAACPGGEEVSQTGRGVTPSRITRELLSDGKAAARAMGDPPRMEVCMGVCGFPCSHPPVVRTRALRS